MKPLLALACITAMSAASAAEIPAGTHLLLRMEHSISSRTAKVGDGVHMRTSIPVSVGGRIVIPIGSYAQGVISAVRHSKRGHGAADLQIQLVTLMLPSGEVLKISPKTTSMEPENAPPTWQNREGRPWSPGIAGASPVGLSVVGLILGGRVGAGVGLAAGAAAAVIPAIAARGKEVELRQGSAVDVVFDQPMVIE
jgi:hypothetical protein